MQGNNALLLLPILAPMLLGLLAYSADRFCPRLRDSLVLAGLCLGMIASLGLSVPVLRGAVFLSFFREGFSGMGLSLRLDGLRAVYLLITSLLWLVAGIYSREYLAQSRRLGRYWLFCLFTLGAVSGCFLSSGLFTSFVFLELLSFTSYPLVIHEENDASLQAGATYLAVAVGCGMVMLLGLLWLYSLTGTLELHELYLICRDSENRSALYAPGALILVGFGAKAGMFPLHIWLPKAHPVAPAPASALLSGVLTKCGIFGVLALSANVFPRDETWGLLLLIPALATMVWGAVLALFSTNLKRTLACSTVSQVGFILTGAAMAALLGEHNAPAVRGTVLHMINHSLFKLILFLCAGMVYRNLHGLDLDRIRGFGRGRPVFAFLFLSASLGIAGVPGWSGYISKTLLHESIAEGVALYAGTSLAVLLRGGEIAFLLTGGLTAAYMAKLCAVLFVEKRPQAQPGGRTASIISLTALAPVAAALLALGLFPQLMEALAALGEGYLHGHSPAHPVHYFDRVNLLGAAISLTIGAAVYFGAALPLLSVRQRDGSRRYPDRWPSRLDLETLIYRPVGRVLIRALLLFARLLSLTARDSRPGRLLSGCRRLFYPSGEGIGEEAPTIGGVSVSLLLFSVGISVLLLYLFVHSLS